MQKVVLLSGNFEDKEVDLSKLTVLSWANSALSVNLSKN